MLNDTRIVSQKSLISPIELIKKIPVQNPELIINTRNEISDILNGISKKKLVIVGPCSVHDKESIIEYASKLKEELSRWENLLVVLRVYLLKPRTSVGWGGILMDPNLDGTCDIQKGLELGLSLIHI